MLLEPIKQWNPHRNCQVTLVHNTPTALNCIKCKCELGHDAWAYLIHVNRNTKKLVCFDCDKHFSRRITKTMFLVRIMKDKGEKGLVGVDE